MNGGEYKERDVGPNWWNVLLGIWVIISPFVLAFTPLREAKWNNVIAGALVGLIALVRGMGSMVNVLLGLWLIASPFALVFSAPVPFWNNIILGVLIALAAVAGQSERSATVPPPA